MEKRLNAFEVALEALPPVADHATELLIISVGPQKGNWSYRHVFTTVGETQYFIFRKVGLVDCREPFWECVDRELNDCMENRALLRNAG